MNETVDYVAMVEQHLSDEAMARRLQEQENSSPFHRTRRKMK